MAKHPQLRKRRIELWRDDPHCHWCGRETRLLRKNKGKQRGGRTEPDQATIDHLYSRLDPRRYEHEPHQQKYVLSCYECNWKRGQAEQKAEQLAGNPSAFNKEVRQAI